MLCCSCSVSDQDEVQQANIFERACWGQVKAMCAQMLQFAKLRRTAESHVMLEKDVFETARERVEKSNNTRIVDEKTKSVSIRGSKPLIRDLIMTVPVLTLHITAWLEEQCSGGRLPHSIPP